jgi:hypothetical protein
MALASNRVHLRKAWMDGGLHDSMNDSVQTLHLAPLRAQVLQR